MKYLFLLLFCGCVTSTLEKPYIKETNTDKNGNVTVRETSADRIVNGKLDDLRTKPK
jgi:hypothetical protein